MKNYKSIVLATLCMSAFLFASCSSDSGDDSAAEESTGDYWPTAVGNQWVLDQSGSEVTMKILGTEGDYFKFNQLTGVGEGIEGMTSPLIKKRKGDYLIKIPQFTFDYGEISGKSTGYEFVFFKDYLDVNETWSGSFSQTTSYNIKEFPTIKMSVTYKGTILEKASSVTVRGVVYNNVVKFKFHQDAKAAGESISSDAEYWLAKDIGIVKYVAAGVTTNLKSYTVKK